MDRLSTPGEGVVDLVGHGGGELAQRCHARVLHEFLLRGLELLRALLHSGFQAPGQLVQLRHGLFQALSHLVECPGQVAQLGFGIHLDGLVQVHVAHRPRPLDELPHGEHGESPRDEDDEEDDERHLQGDADQGPEPERRYLPVYAIQGERHIEHPQHFPVGGMGVARGLAARDLVVDGRDHTQATDPVAAAENPGAGGDVHPHQGLRVRVA